MYEQAKESLNLVKEKNYIDALIDRFNYKQKIAQRQMEEIRIKANNYLKYKGE